MEAQLLEAYLRQGLSMEAIGALTGRHPATIGYWVKRHGLAPVFRDPHAARGGVAKATLEHLIDQGLSTRELATRLDVSQSTIRHWLRRYRLKTRRARRPSGTAVRGVDPERKEMHCRVHGLTEFWIESRGSYRCLRCRSEAVARRRRKLKGILVAEAGGRCSICGYDRHVGALHFHHREGDEKQFGLAERGFSRSLDAARAEAAKCVLLCANCHAEVEAGIVNVN